MRKICLIMAVAVAACCALSGCKNESKKKDRSEANDMFQRITALASHFSVKIEHAPDSAAWAELSRQFEDSLDRISLSYPPDTDLLLTEGQNDTIHTMLQEFISMKNRRIDEILHPVVETDSVASDSLADVSQ